MDGVLGVAMGWPALCASIALWSMVYLGRALDALRRHKEVIPDALLAHVAPLGLQHINFTGDYLNGDAGRGPEPWP